ncbi:uncharacterized protein BJ171DRAFT_9731 [Polychytrium aggregatum]|uniref:uncharacterized protein n=1 Tax=Polychytrium aggregatum TaxID=110093 RepID=UPI0022FE944B|nr:uncharacterized protein BJ171DRAFT_9731 [Polychytrium aggregatum]KAI9209859.1 hypothetical protein BJ171DRAFT_9731 [Polychytrium aggregatum]
MSDRGGSLFRGNPGGASRGAANGAPGRGRGRGINRGAGGPFRGHHHRGKPNRAAAAHGRGRHELRQHHSAQPHLHYSKESGTGPVATEATRGRGRFSTASHDRPGPASTGSSIPFDIATHTFVAQNPAALPADQPSIDYVRMLLESADDTHDLDPDMIFGALTEGTSAAFFGPQDPMQEDLAANLVYILRELIEQQLDLYPTFWYEKIILYIIKVFEATSSLSSVNLFQNLSVGESINLLTKEAIPRALCELLARTLAVEQDSG